jgi:hypothetical protein
MAPQPRYDDAEDRASPQQVKQVQSLYRVMDTIEVRPLIPLAWPAAAPRGPQKMPINTNK